MADVLIERWQLAVLRVYLDVDEHPATVRSSLTAYPGGQRALLWSRQDPVAEFGLPDGAHPGEEGAHPGEDGAHPGEDARRLRVAPDLREAVAWSLREDLGGEAALWLRLVPPSGLLGALRWEQAVIEDARVPLLRVPDRLPVGADAGLTWSVALVVNAEAGASWPVPYVDGLVDHLRSAVERAVEVDVFADAATYGELRHALGDRSAEGLRVHDPAEAVSAWDRTRSRSPMASRLPGPGDRHTPWATLPAGAAQLWAGWLTGGLAGRGVRALHVVSDAAHNGDLPVLALCGDPAWATGRAGWSLVTADDVRAMADAVGASVLSFGSPPGNADDVASRLIADSSGLLRPGPTLYSDVAADPDGSALAQAHAFLANPPGSTSLVRDPSLFAYLQPDHVRAALAGPLSGSRPLEAYPTGGAFPGDEPGERDWSSVLPPSLTGSGTRDLGGAATEVETVPAWLAASERYIDTWVARLVREGSPEGEGSFSKESYASGAAFALEELKGIVARHARGL